MAEFEINKITINDIFAVSALAIEVNFHISPETLTSMLERSDYIAYTAKINGELVGYIIANLVLDECNIVHITSAKSRRRHGVATALLLALETEAKLKGAGDIYLEVRESNFSAKKLYEKSGFGVIGGRQDFYQNPVEDAVLMKKHIDTI